jgi:ABC-2 type transport system ATP-binding protein
MPTDPIVEVTGLVKTYGDFVAVKGITFAILQGEIFGLLGPNGAGKTTTLSVLSCLLAPTAGQATIAGHDVVAEAMMVKRLIGVVPQEIAVYPTLSARDNLAFFGRIYGLNRKRLRARIAEVLDVVGLSERADDAVEHYSGGMKRRLNLAVGLLHSPQVLFLDEPTVGVDPQSRHRIFENVRRLSEEGFTILYTTHYMGEAEALCHRVGIINQGEIIALDTPRHLINDLGGGLICVGIPQLGERMADRIAALPHVKRVSAVDGKLAVEASNAQAALLGIITSCHEVGIAMTSLETLEANLESVFLHLTGRRLRD